MNIRAATLADVAALHELEQQCNPAPWSATQLANTVYAPQPVWVIDLPAHGIVSMLVWQKLPEEAEIHLLDTHPDFRRQGYAQQLLEHLFQHAKQQHLSRILLEVRAGNSGALQLYTNNGFVSCGIRKNYYQNGDDAVLMEKPC